MVGIKPSGFRAEQGKRITVVEMPDEITAKIGIVRKPYRSQCLSDHGVEIFLSTKVECVSDDGIIAAGKNGEKKNIGAFDLIIPAIGKKLRNEPAEDLESKVAQISR